MKAKQKKFKVKMEFRCKETMEIEAESKEEALSKAREEFSFNNATEWDSSVEEVP